MAQDITRVISYVRVSSEKQVEQGLSIPAQIKAIEKYAQDHDSVIVKTFIDKAKTAKSVNRPQFLQMIDFVKKNHKSIDGILVWKFSRFARNREDSILYKSFLRKKLGIQLISISEEVDETPSGKMLEGMIEVIDEFYINNLAQETMRGMVENASSGHSNGGSCPYGFKRVQYDDHGRKRTRLEIDPVRGPIVKRMFDLSEKKVGCREIARKLNQEKIPTNNGKPWGGGRIHAILTNEKYMGTYVWNRKSENPDDVIRVENSHPAIVSREQFERVQDGLVQRNRLNAHPRTVNSKYILSNILYCGKCGSKMFGCSAKSGKYEYYECNTARNKGLEFCDTRRLPKDLLEVHIIEKLKSRILTDDNLTSLVKLANDVISKSSTEYEKRLKEIDVGLEDLQARRLKLYQVIETTELGYEHLAPRIMDLSEQISALEEKRFSIDAEKNSAKTRLLDSSMVKAYVEDLRTVLQSGTLIEQKAFLRSFIKKIVVMASEIKIEYTIPLELEKGSFGKKESSSMVRSGSGGRI